MLPELHTQRYLLQQIKPEDQAFIYQGLSDPQVIPYYGVHFTSFEATAAQMEFYERLWREDFGGDLKRASQMRRRFYGNFWGAPFTDRMIEFARGHRGIRKVLGELVAGDQGYVGLKKKLARSALKPL